MMCARCEELEAENLDLRTMLGVTEHDGIGEAIWRAFRLTRTELRIALLLYARRGATVNRWALIAALDKGYDSSGSLKVHISHMRKKLGHDAIENSVDVGYSLSKAAVAQFDEIVASKQRRAA